MAVTSSRRAMCHVRFKASGHPPRLPPDGRSCKFAKEGHTGPAPAGFYFAPRGTGHGLGAYRRLHDDRYRHCDAGADFPLYGALTGHDDRATLCARVSNSLRSSPRKRTRPSQSYAGLTRASIFFAKSFCRVGGLDRHRLRQRPLAREDRAHHLEAPMSGHRSPDARLSAAPQPL
jgi:hypothetical protein